MNIQQDVPLSLHSTMRLGGPAKYLAEVSQPAQIPELIAWAKEKSLPVIMIGDGSNIVWKDGGFPGLVLVDKLKGFSVEGETVEIAGGENWDEAVKLSVEAGLSGLEFLSLIPGTAGATPVQNVGAYGQEISKVLVSVHAYDAQDNDFVILGPEDCGFGYRTSRFKTVDKGRFFITGITLKLAKDDPQPPFYDSLQKYLDDQQITEYTPGAIRAAVIAIRSSKLPDPAKVANNGSFFANPIITKQVFEDLQVQYPGLVSWETDDGQAKISAAWLVEQAGFGNMSDSETGMGTWPLQALVLVNQHAKSTADLLKYKQKIVDKVKDMFGITLEQEPELLGV